MDGAVLICSVCGCATAPAGTLTQPPWKCTVIPDGPTSWDTSGIPLDETLALWLIPDEHADSMPMTSRLASSHDTHERRARPPLAEWRAELKVTGPTIPDLLRSPGRNLPKSNGGRVSASGVVPAWDFGRSPVDEITPSSGGGCTSACGVCERFSGPGGFGSTFPGPPHVLHGLPTWTAAAGVSQGSGRPDRAPAVAAAR